MNLSSVDFNLLKVLDALISERNVTRAGARLGRSQPAVSNALGKLRKILGDDLLVRGPNGFMLTPRAEVIRAPLREAIGLAESCLAGETQFNPATATGVFRLSTPDRLSISVVPPLFDRLRKLAPNMSLQVLTADRKQALDLLDQDRTDIALGWLDEKPGHLNAEFMLAEKLFCVFRRDHPILKRGVKFNIATVLSFPHVIVSATGNRTAIFDDLLLRHRLRRQALRGGYEFHRRAPPAGMQRHDRRLYRASVERIRAVVQAGQTRGPRQCWKNLDQYGLASPQRQRQEARLAAAADQGRV